MKSQVEIGKEGEQLAADWLCGNGFAMLYRNWRFGRYEIDMITLKNEIPHFIEVKLRSSKDFGPPETCVTKKKISKLLRAIDEFMVHHPQFTDFRLHILSIQVQKDGTAEFCLIEDVYL